MKVFNFLNIKDILNIEKNTILLQKFIENEKYEKILERKIINLEEEVALKQKAMGDIQNHPQ